MPKKPLQIIDENIYEHPAVNAWDLLKAVRFKPYQIEELKVNHKSAIYKLLGIGSGISSIIAKEIRNNESFKKECRIYEEVLPNLPVITLTYYGSIDGQDSESGWIFLEDAGIESFLGTSLEHRRIAGQWLGLVHAAAVSISAATLLPDHGPGLYLKHLRSGRSRILENITNTALNAEEIILWREIVTCCNTLESQWNKITQFCMRMPNTLVHGDFIPKNMRVKSNESGSTLFVFDWEHSGWGMPAADIQLIVDIPSYWSVISSSWRHLDIEDMHCLENFGMIFRNLANIDWSSKSILFLWTKKEMLNTNRYDTWIKKEMVNMNLYHTRLRNAMRSL